jgi:hypothetical protein
LLLDEALKPDHRVEITSNCLLSEDSVDRRAGRSVVGPVVACVRMGSFIDDCVGSDDRVGSVDSLGNGFIEAGAGSLMAAVPAGA